VIVFHFDVIALPSSELITRQPSIEGRRLWSTFFESYKGHMVILADPDANLETLKEWLKVEGFKPSMIHVADTLYPDDHTARSYAVKHLSSTLGKVQWYVDSDGESCSAVLRLGIPILLSAVPQFLRPEWREPKKKRPWESITNEVAAQAIAKAERTWSDE
jgi:hypothetical protein